MTSSRRNTAPDIDNEELRAIVQLRLLYHLEQDPNLNKLLANHSPKELIAERNVRQLDRRVDRILQLIHQFDVDVLTSASPNYPQRLTDHLQELRPPILFLRGRSELLHTRGIGIVGARNSTEYGDSVAEMFATDLARHGFTIISGLARGIDSIAHRAALSVGGNTIAIMGCGVDVYYPPGNAALQDRIAEEGLLVSEFPPGATGHAHHFPYRNRIIALLGEGLVVVEASHKSGTRHTINWAVEHNGEVFAVPGPIGRRESEGTNEAIRDGATMITSVDDIFLKLTPVTPLQPLPDDVVQPLPSSSLQSEVYSTLDGLPTHIDDIARRCNQTAAQTLTVLMQLELEGYAVQHSGKRFSRTLR